ncbi:MAG: peptide-methionine (S)-S-oxide reductase MsrA [Clostridia bacterium]|nr:peptide-methionine (S)-S-oxide reductase MsrA [Clostridia bacterium]
MKNAYFAGGCFWCITPFFDALAGVRQTVAGYCGGDEPSPDYAAVKAQRTGHRETIRVEYDETAVSFETLCKVFLEGVDPFDGGGQFIDRGRSYTLAVYYTDEAQRDTAARLCRLLEEASVKRVFVSIEPLKIFWPAEESHQAYYQKNPEAFAREMETSGRAAAGKSCPMRKKLF